MFRYKCDKCGALLFIDPGEERICDRCREKEERQERERMIYVNRDARESGVRYAG